MADTAKIIADARTELGTTAVGRLRRQGILPCVIMNTDGSTKSIQTNLHELEQLIKRVGKGNLLADMEIDEGKALKAMLKELQYHPVTGKIIHADFAEISMTEKMTVNVAIELTGEAVGVTAGGVLDHMCREVEVECLPADIPEAVSLDIEALEIGGTLSVSDLVIDSKLKLLSDVEQTVVAIHAPRIEEDPADAVEGEGEEGAEGEGQPEVIGGKKEDGEEGEAEKKSE